MFTSSLYSPTKTLVWPGGDYSLTYLAAPCRRLIIGTSGELVLTGLDGHNVIIPALPDGFVLDGEYSAIVAAGTTATNVIIQW